MPVLVLLPTRKTAVVYMDPSTIRSPIQPNTGGLRTLVASFGFGYDWGLMERWVLPLRRHYGGNITVVVQSSDISRKNLGPLAAMHRIELLASPTNLSKKNVVGSRWRDLSIVCDSRYDVCLTADMRDVYWQAPPFAALEDWYVKPGRRIPDLLLTTEHTGVNMLDCKFSRSRVQECYGSDGLKQTFVGAASTNGSIINAGTVMGSPAAYRALAATIPAKSRACSGRKKTSHINDQAILNVLVYTRVLSREHGLVVHVQRNGAGTMLVVSRWGLLENHIRECPNTLLEPPPSTCYQKPAATGDIVLWNYHSGRYECPTVAFPAGNGEPTYLRLSTRMPMLVHMYDRLINDYSISPRVRTALAPLLKGSFSIPSCVCDWASSPSRCYPASNNHTPCLPVCCNAIQRAAKVTARHLGAAPSPPLPLAPARCSIQPRGESSRLLVSMTTVPTRVELVEKVLASVARQTRVPDHVLIVAPLGMAAWRRMWRSAVKSVEVENEQRTQERLARLRLLQLSNKSLAQWGLPVTVTQPHVDHGPVMKLIGALQYLQYRPPTERNATVIMTIDDDLIYPNWACSNLLQWADRCPSAVVAYTGAHYAGMPQAPEEYARAQKFLDGRTLGAYPSGRHRQAPPCTVRQVNYILGWAGVGYRPSFFTSEFTDVSHLAWLAADVRCEEGCSASSAWLDDQYISGHLNKEGVPMYLLPFPTHDSWRFLSHGSAARSSKNRTHLWLQTAWMLMRFAGTGEEAWSLPRAHLCTSDCAKISRNKVPKHYAGANE